MHGLLKFLPFFARYKQRYAAGLFFLLLTNALTLAVPRLIKIAVDSLGGPEPVLAAAGWASAVIAGLAVLNAIVRTQSRVHLLGISRRIEVDVQNAVLKHLQTLPPSYYARANTGDLMSRLINDVRSLRAAAGPGVLYMANAAFLYALAFFSMASLDATLTFWALAAIPVIAAIVKASVRPLYDLAQAAQEKLSELSDQIHENLTGMHVVRSYAMEDFHEKRFERGCREYVERNMALARRQSLLDPALVATEGLAILLVLWKGGERVIAGDISVGTLFAFQAYLFILIWPTQALGWILNTLQRGGAAADRIREILDVKSAANDSRASGGAWNARGDIEVRGLKFSYDGADVLSDVSFRLGGGKTLGIVGRVGAGKSTLVKAFPRLVETPPGAVFAGGRDVTTIPLKELRGKIGYVPQDAFLFSMTIRENVAFGDSDATLDAVRESSRRARFDDEVLSFSAQYDTLVGERGVTLSGGQRQRGTLARALLVEPDILLLDDAFSSVDAQTEAAILAELRELRRGKTTLIVSQRISTVRHADWIIVLDEGRVAEQGTPRELEKGSGLYARLHEQQRLQAELESLE